MPFAKSQDYSPREDPAVLARHPQMSNMDTRKLFGIAIAGALLIVGCGPAEDKKPTQQEIKTFTGTPLTPEQVAKLRGSMGQSGGPMSAGPKGGAPAQPTPAPTGN